MIKKNMVEERFSEFYTKWVWKLEEILHQLLEVSKKKKEVLISEEELQGLVSKVTTHLKEYYTVKWGAAHEDVLVFFSPTWLSPLENAYLWVTGWKPSTVLRLLNMFEMKEEEKKKMIEELRIRIKMEEEKVEREMERQQVAMGDPKMVELTKISCRGKKVEDGSVEVALKGVLSKLENVMKASDCVRLKTLKGVLDVLSPMQCVEFLAAHIAVQLRLRQFGRKKCLLN